MELEKFADIDVSDAVTIGEHEEVFANVLLHFLHAAAGHRVLAGFDEGDLEVLFSVVVVLLNLKIPAETDGEVVVHCFVIKEILLNHLSSVAQAEYEVTKAGFRVDLHYVPEYRATPDFQQWLWSVFGLFPKARALTAAEDDNFHAVCSCNSTALPSSCSVCHASLGRTTPNQ